MVDTYYISRVIDIDSENVVTVVTKQGEGREGMMEVVYEIFED